MNHLSSEQKLLMTSIRGDTPRPSLRYGRGFTTHSIIYSGFESYAHHGQYVENL